LEGKRQQSKRVQTVPINLLITHNLNFHAAFQPYDDENMMGNGRNMKTELSDVNSQCSLKMNIIVTNEVTLYH
jgi:hypothetical protein